MKNIIIGILVVCVIIVNINIVSALESYEKYDCYYLSENINNDSLFKDLEISTCFTYNEGINRSKFYKNDLTLLKNMTKCLDKVYKLNRNTYKFDNKLRYFSYRSLVTQRYSTSETLLSMKKFMYIVYKFQEIEQKRPDLKFPSGGADYIYFKNELLKNNTFKSEQDLEHQIKEDIQLQNDPELNKNLF